MYKNATLLIGINFLISCLLSVKEEAGIPELEMIININFSSYPPNMEYLAVYISLIFITKTAYGYRNFADNSI